MLPKEFDDLVESLKQIPSITTKQAHKIINFLLEQKNNDLDIKINNFISTLISIKECKICSYYSASEICNICSSNKRERKLMIVENNSQIQKYEDWKIYNGKYFRIPVLFTKKFERIVKNFNFDFLMEYIENFDEIIIALSPTAEGVLTSNFIFDKIKKKNNKINISKLAIGIPIGSSVDYIDKLTMSYALKNRKDIE